jgi:hypothetical protein
MLISVYGAVWVTLLVWVHDILDQSQHHVSAVHTYYYNLMDNQCVTHSKIVIINTIYLLYIYNLHAMQVLSVTWHIILFTWVLWFISNVSSYASLLINFVHCFQFASVHAQAELCLPIVVSRPFPENPHFMKLFIIIIPCIVWMYTHLRSSLTVNRHAQAGLDLNGSVPLQ